MAINEENDLIGYDPLAWMVNDSSIKEHVVDDKGCDTDNEGKESQLINDDLNLADDYSDNFAEDTEDNAIMDDVLAQDTVEFESDNVPIEEVSANSMDIIDSNGLEKALSEEGMDDSNVAFQDFIDGEEAENSQIDLDAVLSIQHVVKLHEKLKNALAIHDEIEINASDVSSIDTSTLQLLVSLKKDVVKLQKKVTIIYPSPRFVESAKLLGLLDVLEVYDM